MRRRSYAKGNRAWGECRRSGKRVLLRDMVADEHIEGMLVARDWWEPRHPQERVVSAADAEALYRPAPEMAPAESAISALSAVWTPDPFVQETLDPGAINAALLTLTGSGGYTTYTYGNFHIDGTGSSNFSLVMSSANTLHIQSRATTPEATYSLTLYGTVTDSLGQQITDSLTVSIVIQSAAPATLFDYITALAPTHWWRLNEESNIDGLVDTGSAGNMTLTPAGLGQTYSLSGPALDGNENSILFPGVGVSYAKDDGTSPGVGSSATGTVAFWINRTENDLTFQNVLYFDSGSNFQDAMLFGLGLNFAGDIHRAEVTFFGPGGLGNQRSVYATADTLTSNDAFQSIVFTADGVAAPKIYVNGVLATNSQITAGTVPPATTWFSGAARTRMVMATYPYDIPASIADMRISNAFIIHGTVMTQQQITDMLALCETP